MDDHLIAALIGVGGIFFVKLIVATFGAGKFYQELKDHGRRLKKIEGILNGKKEVK